MPCPYLLGDSLSRPYKTEFSLRALYSFALFARNSQSIQSVRICVKKRGWEGEKNPKNHGFTLYFFSFLHSIVSMNICLMGGWNTDSGASLHGELIGREWVKLGHNLKVLTFTNYAFHGTQITGEDEDFVTRCFTVRGYNPPEFDPIPFLTYDYEILIIEDLGMLPKEPLREIFHRIKKKAAVVNIIHDGQLAKDPAFYQFEWDALTCFDGRYKNFLEMVYDPDKINIIPYPCHPNQGGNKEQARNKLDLPLDKKIIFGFGPASEKILNSIEPLERMAAEYPILLLITIKNKDIAKRFNNLKNKGNLLVEVREEAPDIHRLYDYLYASDLLLFNKEAPAWVVISSTVYQCLGSGCPIVARESGFVEDLDREVLKYSNDEELEDNIRAVFEKDNRYKSSLESAYSYVGNNSSLRVAERFIALFESLKNRR